MEKHRICMSKPSAAIKELLELSVEYCGSQRKLGCALGVGERTISLWLKGVQPNSGNLIRLEDFVMSKGLVDYQFKKFGETEVSRLKHSSLLNVKLLSDLIKLKNISVQDFAKSSKISQSYLYKILDCRVDPEQKTVIFLKDGALELGFSEEDIKAVFNLPRELLKSKIVNSKEGK